MYLSHHLLGITFINTICVECRPIPLLSAHFRRASYTTSYTETLTCCTWCGWTRQRSSQPLPALLVPSPCSATGRGPYCGPLIVSFVGSWNLCLPLLGARCYDTQAVTWFYPLLAQAHLTQSVPEAKFGDICTSSQGNIPDSIVACVYYAVTYVTYGTIGTYTVHGTVSVS